MSASGLSQRGQAGPGSALWTAPEVVRQEVAAAEAWYKADIWSLGCTVIEMCTGAPPWDQFSNPHAALLHLASSNETPQVPSDMSPTAKNFLSCCLNADASCRSSAMELLHHPFLTQQQQQQPPEHTAPKADWPKQADAKGAAADGMRGLSCRGALLRSRSESPPAISAADASGTAKAEEHMKRASISTSTALSSSIASASGSTSLGATPGLPPPSPGPHTGKGHQSLQPPALQQKLGCSLPSPTALLSPLKPPPAADQASTSGTRERSEAGGMAPRPKPMLTSKRLPAAGAALTYPATPANARPSQLSEVRLTVSTGSRGRRAGDLPPPSPVHAVHTSASSSTPPVTTPLRSRGSSPTLTPGRGGSSPCASCGSGSATSRSPRVEAFRKRFPSCSENGSNGDGDEGERAPPDGAARDGARGRRRQRAAKEPPAPAPAPSAGVIAQGWLQAARLSLKAKESLQHQPVSLASSLLSDGSRSCLDSDTDSICSDSEVDVDSDWSEAEARPCMVRAVADFSASDEAEMPFKTGDIIEVVKQNSTGWWLGIMIGSTDGSAPQKGWFPCTFVEWMGRA
ncbi:unnamed protein product [Chrysoparadoxa australica]